MRHGTEIVEADHAILGYAIRLAELNLAGDSADCSGDQGHDDVSKRRDGLVAGKNQDWPATLVCQLKPADLAASYQRSSRIASRALATAHVSSSAF